jgi:signal peptidase II
LKPYLKYFLLALGIIVVDQLVKVLVKTTMYQGETIYVLGDVVKIHFLENPGAAFGMTMAGLFSAVAPMSEETGKLILTLFSVVAAGFIGWFMVTTVKYGTGVTWFLALILGGAIGNIIDRIFYGVWFAPLNDYEGGLLHGRVVDMVYLDIWQGLLPEWIPLWGGTYYSFWPVFNVADAAISTGLVTILFFQNRFFPRVVKQEAPAPSTAPVQEA